MKRSGIEKFFYFPLTPTLSRREREEEETRARCLDHGGFRGRPEVELDDVQRRPPFRVGLMGGVNEEVRLFHELVHRVLRVARIGTFEPLEQVARELVAVVLVPEQFGLDESRAE